VQLDWVPVRRTTAFAVAGRAPSPCLAGRRRPSSPPPVRAASGFARARSSSQCKSRSEWYTPVPYRVAPPLAAARRRASPRRRLLAAAARSRNSCAVRWPLNAPDRAAPPVKPALTGQRFPRRVKPTAVDPDRPIWIQGTRSAPLPLTARFCK
jgi:hypothetical protein